jgi:SAM-dependent methyltransferase
MLHAMGLASLLVEPELQGVDMDSPERIVVHRRILDRKPMIRGVFADFYRTCRALDDQYFGATPGLRVELGAGVSFFKTLSPDVLSTDLVPAAHLDAVVDAQATPFDDASVRVLYGMNCFHHFPEKEAFFRELRRIVPPGGGCVLVEPYFGPCASVLYKRLFTSETFDKDAVSWNQDTGARAMVGANQAASYLVFVRDRARFASLFPDLEIVHLEPLRNYLRYLLSGGLNFRPLVPQAAAGAVAFVETLLTPLRRLLALHHVIVIRKRRS